MGCSTDRPCTSCKWSWAWIKEGLVRCANEDAPCFRQIKGKTDTCQQWERKREDAA